MSGITLVLDLFECKSPALNNEVLLEQLLVSALQFAGMEVLDQLAHRYPGQGVVVVCVLRDAYAALQVLPSAGLVAAVVSVSGKPEAARAALEIVRGYLAQKLIARSVAAHWIDRGAQTQSA
jgi:S-adenosylmethionine/arginine decarboxylase-like enzyme